MMPSELGRSLVPDAALYDELKGQHPQVHILGDAYAPRRLVFATRLAYALAELLVRVEGTDHRHVDSGR